MKITYMAASEDDSQTVEFFGVKFKDGKPVEVDEKANPKLVEKARSNPCFRVEEKPAEVVAAA